MRVDSPLLMHSATRATVASRDAALRRWFEAESNGVSTTVDAVTEWGEVTLVVRPILPDGLEPRSFRRTSPEAPPPSRSRWDGVRATTRSSAEPTASGV